MEEIWVVSTWDNDMVDQDRKTDVRIFVRVWIVVIYWSLSWNWEIAQIRRKYEIVRNK